MNLRLNNKGSIVLFSLALIVFIEMAFVAVQSTGFFTEKKRMQMDIRKLDRLEGRQNYPSEQNLLLLDDQKDELEYSIGEARSKLQPRSFQSSTAEAADFSAIAQGVIEGITKRASLVPVKLPEAGEVGFQRYASGGAVPSAEHVPRLSRQLNALHLLLNVLMECEVSSVDSISRDMFDLEGDNSGRRRRGGEDLGLIASGMHESGLYSLERVGVSFTATEEGVWEVLRKVAEAPQVMAVVEFSHETESDILSYRPAVMKEKESVEDLSYLDGGILQGASAVLRDERILAGGELIAVHLLLDVYDLNPDWEAL